MTSRRCRPRAGLALALVTVHAALILSAWAVANRQTFDLIQLREHVHRREVVDDQRGKAATRLAKAFARALLATGSPDPGQACAVDIALDPSDPAAEVRTFVLTFLPDSGAPAGRTRWRIPVQPRPDHAPGVPRLWTLAN